MGRLKIVLDIRGQQAKLFTNSKKQGIMGMDHRIGKLNSGKFYAYLDGYSGEPFIGTLEEVEVAMGLRKEKSASVPGTDYHHVKTFTVVVRFQYPAWDEVGGIEYFGIIASSKSEANAKARKMAADDGHLGSLKGRVTFTATEEKS